MKILRIYAAAAGISGIFLPFPYTLAAGEAPFVEKTEKGGLLCRCRGHKAGRPVLGTEIPGLG